MDQLPNIDASKNDGTNDGRASQSVNEHSPPDRRREPRIKADLPIQVWGVDTWGERFLQQAHARDISLSGALVSGLDSELRSGDVIGILYAGKQARYRVVWVRHSGSADKVQAAVHRFAPDECPWKDLLAEEQAAAAAITNHTEATRE
jgi:hypothetical protein